MVSSQALRDQVYFAIARGHPKRRACELIGMARSTLRYQPRLPARDAVPLAAMRRFAHQYPRYGYRSTRIILQREGNAMSWQRAHRLWQSAGLQLSRRRPRRRLAGSRPRPLPPTGPNTVWAYDFVFDACANGQVITCLTVIDEFTRECLAIDVAGSIRSRRVVEILCKLRDECLSLEWFRSRLEARVIIEQWRRHYNEVRPHSSLAYRTPVEFRHHFNSLQPGASFK